VTKVWDDFDNEVVQICDVLALKEQLTINHITQQKAYRINQERALGRPTVDDEAWILMKHHLLQN
jgi:hypothetical protein